MERDLPFSYHEIAGKEVNEVILPNTVTTLHSYSFYNCKELVTLTFGAALNEVNGDSFMNCSHLHRLIVNASVLLYPASPIFFKRSLLFRSFSTAAAKAFSSL